MADPRRSARARTAQMQSNGSSTTSSTSGRIERNTRSYKAGSPQKSSSGSLSSEPLEDTIVADDVLPTRRTTRGQEAERGKMAAQLDSIEMREADEEEDEAVRCICGYDEYPGPPPVDEDTKRRNSKDGTEIDPIFEADVTDDAAGFFVQCDICKVWQHGACVGIMTEEASPDEYFCEKCRKDLHSISTAINGQKYSHYLPLRPPALALSRSTSVNKDAQPSPPKERESRSARATSITHSKRRSTMNSQRYDEEEALRRAIEASKEDAIPEESLVDGPRRPKRGRSDSEEWVSLSSKPADSVTDTVDNRKHDPKRQRTASRSVSPLEKADDSDDQMVTTRNGSAAKSKVRPPAPLRSQRSSEKEERERLRAEQANRRKGRAERRRVDDSDPSEEIPLAARTVTHKFATNGLGLSAPAVIAEPAVEDTPPSVVEAPPPSSQPKADSPPLTAPTATAAKADKKRSHKKKGRNQYTRDRDDDPSPARSQSRDVREEHTSRHNENTSKAHSKFKGGMGSKVTIVDMKRRATALLNYITQTQMELAAEDGLDTESSASKDNLSVPVFKTALGKDEGQNGATATASRSSAPDGEQQSSKEFKDLNCMEMMDRLTTRLVKWQQEYGA